MCDEAVTSSSIETLQHIIIPANVIENTNSEISEKENLNSIVYLFEEKLQEFS